MCELQQHTASAKLVHKEFRENVLTVRYKSVCGYIKHDGHILVFLNCIVASTNRTACETFNKCSLICASASLAHRAYPEQGGPPPRPINHAIIEQNNIDHRVPPPVFVFSPYSICLSQLTNFFLPLPQVPNAPGTSPPAVESSSRPAFQRSTPTTWTAHS